MNRTYTRRCFVASAPAIALSACGVHSGAGEQVQDGSGLLLSYRILPGQWETDAQFAALLRLLQTNRGAVDEISFFDETFPRPAGAALERLTRVSQILAQRMVQLRSAGVGRVGINVTYTLGHQDVAGDFFPKLAFAPAVGHDGQTSVSCACPNHGAYRDYLRRRYALMAGAHPDFIWVDDDFRMTHHGVHYPCFCPVCLEKFGRETSRAGLVQALNAPGNTVLRQAWVAFCAASLESLAGEIRQAVATVNPGIEMGLMTIGYSHSTYAYSFNRWMRALGARRGRPGHGYYTDETPRAIIHKAMDVGRQVRDYPAEVKTILYELENWPFIRLDKSSQTVLNESVLAIAMGCTGVAYDALPESPGPLDDYQHVLRAIGSERTVWSRLLRARAGLPLVGFWPADTPNLMANRKVDAKGWFWEGGPYDILRPDQLAEMGLPLTTFRDEACGILLAGKIAEAFSDAELRNMLAGAVLLDGDALQVLWDRKLGELTGVKPGDWYDASVTERLTDHPLNGGDAGVGREALITAQDAACSLVPVADGVACLSRLVRYDGADCGSCFSIYTNRWSGRIAVSSYAPWSRLGRGGKRRQLLAVTDWLSSGRLPVIIEQTVRVAPIVRRSPDGQRLAVVLLNLGLEATGPLTMRARARARRISLITSQGEIALPLKVLQDELSVEVPSIPAWQTAILAGS